MNALEAALEFWQERAREGSAMMLLANAHAVDGALLQTYWLRLLQCVKLVHTPERCARRIK